MQDTALNAMGFKDNKTQPPGSTVWKWSKVSCTNKYQAAYIKGYLGVTDKGSSGGRGKGKTIMTICGSQEGFIKEVTFELDLKECSVFNRQEQKQLLLGARLMFAEGINERHRCEMCLRNSKFSSEWCGSLD